MRKTVGAIVAALALLPGLAYAQGAAVPSVGVDVPNT